VTLSKAYESCTCKHYMARGSVTDYGFCKPKTFHKLVRLVSQLGIEWLHADDWVVSEEKPSILMTQRPETKRRPHVPYDFIRDDGFYARGIGSLSYNSLVAYN
jgi:hypothetical protein